MESYNDMFDRINSAVEKISKLRDDALNRIKALEARNKELTMALEELFEESNPICPKADECFSSSRCGRGAYETPEANMSGGCWFSECSCMTDVQRKVADVLDTVKGDIR